VFQLVNSKSANIEKLIDGGFFAGKIDYSRLKLLPRLFVRFIIRAKEGDYRNWQAIRAWAENIRQDLVGSA
jgi:menaquinone-dependent protoporphyrinogen IX oxidase